MSIWLFGKMFVIQPKIISDTPELMVLDAAPETKDMENTNDVNNNERTKINCFM